MGHQVTGCRSGPMCACGALAKDGTDTCEKCLFRARIQHNLCDGQDVLRQPAVSNRILCDELQQRWIAKVVAAFKRHVLARKFGMLLEVGAQTGLVARINEVNGVAEDGVFDPFVMRQVQSIGRNGLFNAPFETGPAGEAVPPGHHELGGAQPERDRRGVVQAAAAMAFGYLGKCFGRAGAGEGHGGGGREKAGGGGARRPRGHPPYPCRSF